MSNITIIGAGMMGSAMSLPARDNGHRVVIVGTHLDGELIEYAKKTGGHLTMNRPLPRDVEFLKLESLERAVRDADLVICGVSSFGVEWFAEYAAPRIPAHIPILSVTKGLLDMPNGTLRSFPDFLREADGGRHSFSAIGGPCTSYELADRRHSAVVFCGYDIETLKRMRSMLRTDYYHISLSGDVIGVECAVAMKNAYALAVSLAIGMIEREEGEGATLAYNPQAALFGQSVREISRILALVGGGAQNIVYAAGDLYVTIFGGRTRRLGALLGYGLPFAEAMERLSGITLESVVIAERTIRAVEARALAGDADKRDFPLLFHIGKLLSGETGVPIPWEAFETVEA